MERKKQVLFKKNIDSVLGIQTHGRRMVGSDDTTELMRPPKKTKMKWWIK